jgi:hypothetical protein
VWGGKYRACLVLLGVSLGVVGGARSEGAEKKDPKPRLLLPFDAAAVRQTVEGARARLQQPSCQGLLEEFGAADGKSLRGRLDESGKTLDRHLAELHFFDASDLSTCRSSRVYAFTRPGLGAVYVCTAQFTPTRLREPQLVEAVVIHELLHTIGLGENPPSPEHITARVKDRCHGRESALSR